jgi:hypothetical protein
MIRILVQNKIRLINFCLIESDLMEIPPFNMMEGRRLRCKNAVVEDCNPLAVLNVES